MSEINTKPSNTDLKLLNPQPLYDYLEKYNGAIYFNTDENLRHLDEINYPVLGDMSFNIKKLNSDSINRIFSNMKLIDKIDLTNSILNILQSDSDLLILSEIIGHGVSLYDAKESVKTAIKYIESYSNINIDPDTNSNGNKSLQIIVENQRLEHLVLSILKHADYRLIFSPTATGRSVLSAFVLISLLSNKTPQSINKILFLSLPADFPLIDSIITTENSIKIDQTRSILSIYKTVFIESNNENHSCFVLMGDCDLFSGVLNYLHSFGRSTFRSDRARLCLVQENVFDRFLAILRSELTKSRSNRLFDMNRRLSLDFIDRGIIDSIIPRSNQSILSSIESSCDDNRLVQPFIFTGVQPQQDLFSDKSIIDHSSFILTFRTCEESILLANKLIRFRSRLFLWSENISQTFELKSRFDYDEIIVNLIEFPLIYRSFPWKIVCFDSISATSIDKSKNSLSNHLKSAIEFFGKNSENRSFSVRLRRVKSIVGKLVADRLLTIQSIDWLKNLRGLQANRYEIDGLNHVLIERKSIGCVVLYFGNLSVTEHSIQLILLAWLLGNDVIIISDKTDLHNLNRSLIETHEMRSMLALCGSVTLAELGQYGFIDSVIALDQLAAGADDYEFDFKFRLLSKSIVLAIDFEELFKECLEFLTKTKLMCVAAGGINTK